MLVAVSATAQTTTLDAARIPRAPQVAVTPPGLRPLEVRVLVVELNPLIPAAYQRTPVLYSFTAHRNFAALARGFARHSSGPGLSTPSAIAR